MFNLTFSQIQHGICTVFSFAASKAKFYFVCILVFMLGQKICDTWLYSEQSRVSAQIQIAQMQANQIMKSYDAILGKAKVNL